MPRLVRHWRCTTVRWVLSVVIALALCAFLAFAQVQENKSTKFKPRNVTVTGCLQAGSSANELTITGADGKKYELTSGRIELKRHVGQKVQVSGTERAEEYGVGLIRVTALKKVSNTCQ